MVIPKSEEQGRVSFLKKKKKKHPPLPPRPSQPDTYMITLAGAGSFLGRTGRGGGRGRVVDRWWSNSRSTVGGRRGSKGGGGGGELRRRSSSRSSSSSGQPGLLTDLTRGQRGRRPLGSSKIDTVIVTCSSLSSPSGAPAGYRAFNPDHPSL